ncbi:MAG: hypothetical protein LBF01_00330, partial [Bacteroidales bacterium]|nr:hypothetical protein [Bacteroidales bacterium]
NDAYEKVVKVYCINIVYFPLGAGSDYVYHGIVSFNGANDGSELNLSDSQRINFSKEYVHEIFPEFYILDVTKFDDIAKDPLSEWMYYLKNYKIEDSFNARGLRAAGERLKYNDLSESDQRAYDRKVHYARVRLGEKNSVRFLEAEGMRKGKEAGLKEGLEEGTRKGKEEGLKEGLKEGVIKTAKKMLSNGMNIKDISVLTDLTLTELSELSEQLSKSKAC